MSGLPVLVMLPGTLCDSRVFQRQKRALRGLARVLTADCRAPDDVGAWAHQLLRRLPARFSVVGFSLGGICALELLRHAPERIEGLALLASNAMPGGAAGRRKGTRMRKTLRRAGARALVQPLKSLYFHRATMRRLHGPLIGRMAQATPPRVARRQFAWAADRPDSHATLAEFAGRVLLVGGARDPLCPPAWQQSMLQAQPRASLIELPRTGHFVTLEAPARVNNALRRWMQS